MIGKELDSLADVVSFGVAPAVIIYQILNNSNYLPSLRIGEIQIVPFISLMIPICSALRLAKFNTDQDQKVIFKGLPTPANALLFASFPLIIQNQLNGDTFIQNVLSGILNNFYFLFLLILLSSFLLVSNIKMISLKFSDYSWKHNKNRYLLLGFSAILLILFHYIALPIIIFLYILLSIINHPKNEIYS